ncbi:unnamed protein product [Clavelina lepadiformis]|uniref:G-protein coupled receptors family 1 profile domain-containing protein n=1 Tax=Clavelina lepadiformis TaxID=159417 RepID=A0ABP0GTT2_CLALP
MQSANLRFHNFTNVSLCRYLPYCDVNYVNDCHTTTVRKCEACNIHGASLILAIFIIAGILITVGNILIIASVVFCDKRARTKYDLAKASLAFANFTVGVAIWLINIPHVIWSLGQTPLTIGLYVNQSANSALAIASATWFTFLFSSSVYHLLYMSIQRMIAVRWPIYYRNLSFKKVYLHLLLVWCFSLLASTPILPGNAIQVAYRANLFSFLPIIRERKLSETVVVLFGLVILSVPYVIMTILTIITAIVLNNQTKKSQTLRLRSPSASETAESRAKFKEKIKENRAFITLVFLQIGFTALIVPMFLSIVLNYAAIIDCTQGALNFAFYFASKTSSLANVIIYTWRDRGFQSFIRRICKRLCTRRLELRAENSNDQINR